MLEPGLADAGHLVESILFAESANAALVLERFFRQHHSGSQERGRITELVFYVLRHRRRLEALLRTTTPGVATLDGMALVTAALLSLRGWPPERLASLLGIKPDTVTANLRHDPPPLTAAERVSLPGWLWQQWQKQWGSEQAEQLGHALNQPAKVDLRVNTLRTTRQKLIQTLATLDIQAKTTPFAPMGLRLAQRYALQGLAPFKLGLFEVQDEGSQLIAHLLNPQPGWTVVDLCAGAGGKSLHMAALMKNRGKIVATDIDQRRLSRLSPRLKRAGVRIVRTQGLRHERDPKLKRLESRADAVLVDAPCSGTGTLRRHPDLKWHLQAEQVASYQDRQCALLEAGARLTRPRGRLLYATCSLLQAENQDVVRMFLADNRNFQILPVTKILAYLNIEGLPQSTPFLTLLPHQTATDGFFAALFQRNS